MYTKLTIALLATFFTIGTAMLVIKTSNDIELRQLDAKTKQNEINTLQQLNEAFEAELQEADKDLETLEELRERQTELEKENERLQQELAAKRAREAREASQRSNVAYAAETTGDCASWISAAGITDLYNANELIRRESNCNPYAVNPSSGACGVAQELPCGKSGCSMGDGACQVNWMNNYVLARYGSWSSAIAFHNANNWY